MKTNEREITSVLIGGRENVSAEDFFDGKLVSSILTYIYGDKKTVRQIARHLTVHQMRVVLCLDYMIKNNLIVCTEETLAYGIERYYFVPTHEDKIKMETKVKGKAEKIRVANELGDQLRDVIVSLSADDKKNISYTVSMIAPKDADLLVKEQKRLELMMTEMEKEDKHKEEGAEKYIMISTLAPYKLDGVGTGDGENNNY